MKQAKELKKLKEKLEEIRQDLHDVLPEMADLGFNVEFHIKIERDHYQIDLLKLYKEIDFDKDEDDS